LIDQRVDQSATGKTSNQNSKAKTELRQRCLDLSLKIIRYIKDLPEGREYKVLVDQLLRSATSIGANIVEAKSASSKRDFIKYFEIALKSANETVYWLEILREIDKTDSNRIQDILNEVEVVSRIIAKSVLTMKGRT
jgi:four helix bundle protein